MERIVASRRSGSKDAPSKAPASVAIVISWTFIAPVVRVPVLSKTIVSTLRATSSTRGFRIMIPRCAPRADATNNATGVANPSAHGQAITITAIALAIDSEIE